MSVETRKILTPIKIMEVSSAQKQGEWKLRNTLLIPNSKLLFSSKKQFRIYNYQESCQPGSVARMKLQQEFVSVHIWTRLTEGCLQFLGVYMRTQPKYCSWVFTFGTSPVTAPLLCTIHQLYLGQISASAVGVYMWTQPSYYLNHYLLGKADQDSESFESESLVTWDI